MNENPYFRSTKNFHQLTCPLLLSLSLKMDFPVSEYVKDGKNAFSLVCENCSSKILPAGMGTYEEGERDLPCVLQKKKKEEGDGEENKTEVETFKQVCSNCFLLLRGSVASCFFLAVVDLRLGCKQASDP